MAAIALPFKILIRPVDHYVGPRFSWRGWHANIAANAPDGQIVSRCVHEDGHRTTDAAITCGKNLYRAYLRTPAAKAVA